MTPSDLLNLAAKHLEEGSPNDGECIVTALVAVMPLPEEEVSPTHGWDTYAIARDRICQVVGVPPRPCSALYRWHDTPGRKRQDVIDALRKAART